MSEVTYKAIHKCRLCGKIFEGAITGNKCLVIQSIIDMDRNRYTIPQAPNLIDIHHCENGGIGCADFMGWKVGE